jgi:hypothetical protein
MVSHEKGVLRKNRTEDGRQKTYDEIFVSVPEALASELELEADEEATEEALLGASTDTSDALVAMGTFLAFFSTISWLSSLVPEQKKITSDYKSKGQMRAQGADMLEPVSARLRLRPSLR